MTDIFSGTTECEALAAKTGIAVMEALHRIEDRLPFKIIALYMDNGSEFLNEDVHVRFSQTKKQIPRDKIVEMFRSRPYKKNDQCYVEQKNYRELGQTEGVPHLAQIKCAHFIDKVLLFLSSFASKTPPSLFARTAISGILGLTI